MLVVKVELHPFSDPKNIQTLASINIVNTGTSDDPKVGHYNVYALNKNGKRYKKREVKNHPRLAVSVWKLVSKALKALEHDELSDRERIIIENRYALRVLAERAIFEEWGEALFNQKANELNDNLQKELEK